MTSVKKILIITPFFPPDKGGISTHVYNLNTNLIKQGCDITTIASKPVGNKKSTSYNHSSHISRLNSVYLPAWPYPTLKSFSIPIDLGLKIDSIMRNGNFDVVHVHGHHYPVSWMGIRSAHKYNIPSVLTLHGMYALNSNVLGGSSWLEDLFNKLVFSRILSKTVAVIGLTDQITKYAKGFNKKSIKYFTIPNGVNTSVYTENMKRKIEYRQKYHIGQNKTVILFCGRFEKVKGILEFASAVKGLTTDSEIEILLVGGGSLESSVKAILHGIEGIHILDWQPMDKIHEIFIASDIFINPSKFEALPLTVIEAMNAGLHIVYTPVGGVPDILREYSMKTMLKEVSPNAIKEVLTNLNSDFSTSDIENCLYYARKFDWEDIASKTKEAYSQIISK